MDTYYFLTPEEIANICKIEVGTVRRAIRGGHLRAALMGEERGYRVLREDFNDWISQRYQHAEKKRVKSKPRRSSTLRGACSLPPGVLSVRTS